MEHETSTGTLFLPTDTRDNFIVIDGITPLQALNFVNVETKRIVDSKKIKNNSNKVVDDDHMIFVTIANNNEELFLQFWSLSKLEYSDTPKIRGDRAIYFNETSGIVGMGTTVIYNRNWATIGFDDPKFHNMIHEFVNVINEG
mgnify:CR=1 FL=1